MSDEREKKLRDYQIDYQKKLNNKFTNDKIIDDNDNDFYCISIIIKLKKIWFL